MPRKALSGRYLLAAFVLSGIVVDGPARGQAPGVAPPGPAFSGFHTVPDGAPAAAPAASIPGTGNPFIRRGFPRSTLMAPHGGASVNFDANLTPVTFDQPLAGPTPPSSSAPVTPNNELQPNSFASPTTNVLPNYAAPSGNASPPAPFAAGGATPIQVPAPTPQNAAPISGPAAGPVAGAAIPAAPQPGLQGVALLRSLIQSPPAAGHPLEPILAWSEQALRQMEGLTDYTCTFKKREFVDGEMQEQQSMYVKSRPNPLSVYLLFLAPRDLQGQEAIYVAGRNEGRILAHPVGLKQKLVGTVALEPTDPQAMGGNRHPITDFGIRRLCERYRDGLRDDMQFGECALRIIDNVAVEGRPCVCIELSHPVPRQEFKFHVTRLFVDAEWNLPIRLEGYAWPQRPGEQPLLVEEYTYANLRLNVGLTDADFDVRNPQYRY